MGSTGILLDQGRHEDVLKILVPKVQDDESSDIFGMKFYYLVLVVMLV